MWARIKVVASGAKTVKVDKNKYLLGGSHFLPKVIENVTDEAQKSFFTIFGK